MAYVAKYKDDSAFVFSFDKKKKYILLLKGKMQLDAAIAVVLNFAKIQFIYIKTFYLEMIIW